MKAYVLAAGEGTRLWPISQVIPKCLLPVKGKPAVTVIAENLLYLLGIEHVDICCLTKDLPLFQHEFRDFGKVGFIPTENPAGTAGQIASETFGGPILVWYGDCLVDVTKEFIISAETSLFSTPQMLGVLLCTTKARSDFGRVVIGAQNNLITRFDEKPLLEGLTWTGVAVFSPEIKGYLESGKDFARDVFPLILREGGRLFAYITEAEYVDIGNVEAYRRVNEQ